ncbi:MAG: hypothetical protein OXP71_01475 [Candidatus Poribacteria bacterium]|nr:hypothetical protein [Candidatus Poribacteria bacterium]
MKKKTRFQRLYSAPLEWNALAGLVEKPNRHLSSPVGVVGNCTDLKMSIKKPSFEERNSVSRRILGFKDCILLGSNAVDKGRGFDYNFALWRV